MEYRLEPHVLTLKGDRKRFKISAFQHTDSQMKVSVLEFTNTFIVNDSRTHFKVCI